MQSRPSMTRDISIRGNRYLVEPANAYSGAYTRVGSVLVSARSPYQVLEILETPQFGRVLRLDGYMMTTEKDEFHYHESLVHVPAIAHAAPEHVLIIGGGDGGVAKEVLKYRSVARVDLVEIDLMVVKLSRTYLPTVHAHAYSNPRLKLHIADGRGWLQSTAASFDLIVLDLTDPIGAAHALYTTEFYAECRAHLKPGGLLALHAESPFTRPGTFNRIVKTVQSAFPCVRPYLVFVPSYGTVLSMVTASLHVDPARLPAEEVDDRFRARGIHDLRWMNGETHAASFALPTCVQTLLSQPAQLVEDRGPRLDESDELQSRDA